MISKIKSLLFRNTGARQTVTKNAFWLVVANFGGRFLRAVVIIVAARLLGAEGYGVFSYAISLIAFVTIFIDLGLGPVMTRELAREPGMGMGSRAQVISTVFYMKTLLLAIGVLSVLFVAPHLSSIKEALPLFPLIIFILIFDVARDFTYNLVRAMEHMEIEAFTYVGMNLVIMTAGLIFLAIHPSAYAFTLAYVLGTGMGSVSAVFIMRKEMRGIFSKFSWPLVRPLLATAAPFAVSGVMGAFFINTDILVIGALRSAGDVGLYAAAQRIVQLLYLVPGILGTSLFPLMSRLANRDDKRFTGILTRVFHLTYLLALPIAVGGVIFGYQIITFIFGSEYARAVPAFQVLLVTILADFPAAIRANVLFAYDRQKKLVAYAAIGGILNIVLDVILIPMFGIVGSSWATLVSQVVSNTYLWYTMRQANPISVFSGLKRVALATAFMGAFAWFLSIVGIQVIFAVILSGAFYFGFLLLLREPLFKQFKFVLAPNET